MRSKAQSSVKTVAFFMLAVFASIGLTVFGSTSTAYAWTTGDDYPDKWKGVAQDSTTDDWGQYNRECTSWVAWALHSRNGFEMPMVSGNSGAADWGYAARSGYAADGNPAVGSVAWWDYGTGTGHVSWVAAVSADKKSVTIEDYNSGYDGKYSARTIQANTPKGYIHFKDLDSNPDSGGGSAPTIPQIFQVKRTTDPNGVRQVYAATNTAVTEGWWVSGGDGVHLHEVIRIDQHNIVGFDKVNLPGGTQAIYTAVSNGVYETWWKPNGTTGTSQIVSGLSGVKGVYANNTVEAGQFVHHLYILAGDGPYEAWWKDGGDGVHLSRLTSINGGTTFTMSAGPDGKMQLYVATPTWVYEVQWVPGSNSVQTRSIINITQGDIRQLAKAANLSDGTQRLYTTTSTTVWESKWDGSGAIQASPKVVNQTNAIASKHIVTSGTNQLYVATGNRIQEYWWTDSGSGGSTLTNIAQGNIGAIDKVNDGSAQQLYTGAGSWVYETWWGGGNSPNTSGLFSVAH